MRFGFWQDLGGLLLRGEWPEGQGGVGACKEGDPGVQRAEICRPWDLCRGRPSRVSAGQLAPWGPGPPTPLSGPLSPHPHGGVGVP